MSRLLSWQEVPVAGWLEKKGNAAEYETGGDWRTIKPVWIEETASNACAVLSTVPIRPS